METLAKNTSGSKNVRNSALGKLATHTRSGALAHVEHTLSDLRRLDRSTLRYQGSQVRRPAAEPLPEIKTVSQVSPPASSAADKPLTPLAPPVRSPDVSRLVSDSRSMPSDRVVTPDSRAVGETARELPRQVRVSAEEVQVMKDVVKELLKRGETVEARKLQRVVDELEGKWGKEAQANAHRSMCERTNSLNRFFRGSGAFSVVTSTGILVAAALGLYANQKNGAAPALQRANLSGS